MQHWTGPAPKDPAERYFCACLGGGVLVVMAVALLLLIAGNAQRQINQTVADTRRAEAVNARHEWSLQQFHNQRLTLSRKVNP